MLHVEYFAKFVGSAIAGMGLVILHFFFAEIPSTTEWGQFVEKYGIPLAFCIVFIYGIVALFKALQEQTKARIDDKESMVTLYRSDTEKAIATRQNLADALTKQASALESLEKTLKAHELSKTNSRSGLD